MQRGGFLGICDVKIGDECQYIYWEDFIQLKNKGYNK